jgi:hypothetical protein
MNMGAVMLNGFDDPYNAYAAFLAVANTADATLSTTSFGDQQPAIPT